MQFMHLKSAPGRGNAAFTLIEMLVVIAIISILMTVGTIGISGMGGKGVTSGVASAEALFDEARTTAEAHSIRACVLVAKALTNNPADDLRRVLVAYEEVDANGLPKSAPDQEPNWVLSSRGAVLPEKVYFSKQFSRKDTTGGGGPIDEITDGKIKDAKDAYKGSYFIYQFNDQGICKTPGASFIIGSGTRNPGKSATEKAPRVTAEGKRDFGGFVVWRSGRTSVFRSTEQMGTMVKSIRTGAEF